VTKRANWGWLTVQDFLTWAAGVAVLFVGATRTPVSEVLVFAGLAILGVPLVRPKGGG
jgi:hypothetical protein